MKTTEYKDSEVGRIPADWKVAQLKDLTDIITGATPSTSINEYWNGDIPWMSSGELNMKLVRSVYGRITQKGYDSCGTHMIPPLCVLIGLAGQGKTRGTAAINYISLCTNQSIASILPSSYFDSFFLFYWLDNQYYNLRMLSAGDGGRGGLNKQLLLNLWVPLPPLKEQNAIANSLSSIDSLISSLDELVEKKRMIKDGLMQELLTGKKRLAKFNGEWKQITLGEYCSIVMGQSPSSTFYNQNGVGLPLIQGNSDFENRKSIIRTYTSYITKTCNQNDTIMSVRAPVGAVGKASSDSCLGRGVCAFRTDTDFLFYYMQYNEDKWGQFSKGSTFDSVNRDDLCAVIISVPPSKKEESAICDILSSFDKDIEQAISQRDKYLLIKQGMMQQLLTGKTRL